MLLNLHSSLKSFTPTIPSTHAPEVWANFWRKKVKRLVRTHLQLLKQWIPSIIHQYSAYSLVILDFSLSALLGFFGFWMPGVSLSNPGYILLIVIVILHKAISIIWYFKKVEVPSVGANGIFGSWVSAFQWQSKARKLIQEGYEKVCQTLTQIILLSTSFANTWPFSMGTTLSRFQGPAVGRCSYAMRRWYKSTRISWMASSPPMQWLQMQVLYPSSYHETSMNNALTWCRYGRVRCSNQNGLPREQQKGFTKSPFLCLQRLWPGREIGLLPRMIHTSMNLWGNSCTHGTCTHRTQVKVRTLEHIRRQISRVLYLGWNYIDHQQPGSCEFSCFETGTKIVSHLTAKSLVGYPLCRDTKLVEMSAQYGNAVPTSGFFIAMFPEILRPYVQTPSRLVPFDWLRE